MIETKSSILEMINSSARAFRARVELHNGSTLEKVCTCSDVLSDFEIERAGANDKFFGYGICQKLKATLIDLRRELNITKAHTIEAAFGVDSDYTYSFPIFYVEECDRDENSNIVTVTAYDALYKAANHTVEELGLVAPYTLKAFATACATLLGLPLRIEGVNDSSFNTSYANGANFDGSESIRSALDAIAEATQTIYFINGNWELTFKRLDRYGAPVAKIDREKSISLTVGDSCQLMSIVHTTELGETLEPEYSIDDDGAKQYVRDNPFWENRADIARLLENAYHAASGLTINQFDCTWRGNFLIELGDKIFLTAKDNNNIISYLLDDVIAFNGSLSQSTKWEYKEDEAETATNPTNLGDALNKTFAKVDKVEKTITLHASDIEENKADVAQLMITTSSINMQVSEIEAKTNSTNSKVVAVESDMASFKLESDNALLEFKRTIVEDGVTKLDTGTGFKFDETGLTIDETGSALKTHINNDGMTVSRGTEPVLVANNEGVVAEDLKATTYLMIGNTSRFEDWEKNGEARTACFWYGGINF